MTLLRIFMNCYYAPTVQGKNIGGLNHWRMGLSESIVE